MSARRKLGRSWWRTLLRRAADRRGAVAVMFALTILPVLGFVALAFDVGSAVWARGELDLAADAAALTAATTGSQALALDSRASLKPAQAAGSKRFYAKANQMPGVSLGPVDVAVSNSGLTVTAVANYSATYNTRFAGLFGFPTFTLSNTAVSTKVGSVFVEITFMIDRSPSMAIAASQADMDRLGRLTSANRKPPRGNESCQFACHFDPNFQDYYGLARQFDVKLRIDVLRAAVQQVIRTISQVPTARQFSVGIYTFGTPDAAWWQNALPLSEVFPSSNDFAGAVQALESVTLPYTPDGNIAWPLSNHPAALQKMTETLPPSGDGFSAASPRRYLFILTDGVEDYYDGWGNRISGAIDPTLCSALKAKGVQVLTLYTYLGSFFDPATAAQIQSGVRRCASSPAFAFEATDTDSINAALQAMLRTVLSIPARFTQ